MRRGRVRSRRGLGFAVKRGDGDTERVGKLQGQLCRDLREPGLAPVDLQVGEAEAVGELLPAPLPLLSYLLDTTSNERWFVRHQQSLSNLDRPRNDLSAVDVQVGDSLGPMQRSALPLPIADYEEWARDLGVVTEADEIDWPRIIKEASIGSSQQYLVKDRWGTNPFQMAKVHAALKRLELKRKVRTPTGAKMLALEEWLMLGREIARKPDVLAVEIERVRGLAADVKKAADADKAKAEAEAKIAEALGTLSKKPRE